MNPGCGPIVRPQVLRTENRPDAVLEAEPRWDGQVCAEESITCEDTCGPSLGPS